MKKGLELQRAGSTHPYIKAEHLASSTRRCWWLVSTQGQSPSGEEREVLPSCDLHSAPPSPGGQCYWLSFSRHPYCLHSRLLWGYLLTWFNFVQNLTNAPAMRFIKGQKFLKMPFIEMISLSWRRKRKAQTKTSSQMWDQRSEENKRES